VVVAVRSIKQKVVCQLKKEINRRDVVIRTCLDFSFVL